MKNKYLILLGPIVSVFLINLVYGFSINNNFPKTVSNKDTINSLEITPYGISNITQEYTDENKRYGFNGDNIFTSETYGSFSSNGKGYLIKSSLSNNCGPGNLEFYFNGSVINTDWGEEFNFSPSSYYCPDSGNYEINLLSDFFEDFSTTSSTNYTEVLTDLDSRVIFDSSNISVNGIVNSQVNIENEFEGGTNTQLNNNSFEIIETSLSGKIGGYGSIKGKIEKNINNYTNGLNYKKNNFLLTNLSGQELFLYDYSGQSETTPSNANNKGKILNLGGNSLGKIGINGEKNLVLKGGNLYINADIYNEDTSSILTIVVLRDDDNKLNGGNIYINPDVTNIDAVLISEGSILNFDGTKVLNESDIVGDNLRKQLLLYGSVFSRNTVGEGDAPYDSDDYLIGNKTTSLYNLSKLRYFQTSSNDYITNTTDDFYSSDSKVIALDASGAPIKYAFAGKREKFANDNVSTNLRGTNKYSGLVIEYNSAINLLNPKFLQN